MTQWFRDSVNILTSLLNNLISFCLMFFKFSTHLHHQTTHVWYEFKGQRVSFARVMGLFKSIHRMFAIVLIVHTLWNQLLLQLSIFSFYTLHTCSTHIEDVHKDVLCWKKKEFWQIYSILNFFDNCHIQKWLVVHSLWNQLLLGFSVFLFNTLQTCFTHFENEHEEL